MSFFDNTRRASSVAPSTSGPTRHTLGMNLAGRSQAGADRIRTMTKRLLLLAALGSAFLLPLPAHADKDTLVTVHKTPWCGCCEVWTDAVKAAGYTVIVEDHEDLGAIKQQAGIPDTLQACHTAVIGKDRKYILEGHVPLEAMNKLMSERPDIRGLAVPGMPQGSLGMGHDPGARYTVYEIGAKAADTPKPFMQMGQ